MTLAGGIERSICCFPPVVCCVECLLVQAVSVTPAEPTCRGQACIVTNADSHWLPRKIKSVVNAFKALRRLRVPFARCITGFPQTAWYSHLSLTGNSLLAESWVS